MYYSTKTYDHSEGLSCCFRQWRATSHCNLLHGYALSFTLTFAAERLDHRNWVVDFGGLKEIKTWLHQMFDHTCLIAEDDPHLEAFKTLHELNLIDLRIMPNVGCEATARYVLDYVQQWLKNEPTLKERVHISSVQCCEHSGNSAIASFDQQ